MYGITYVTYDRELAHIHSGHSANCQPDFTLWPKRYAKVHEISTVTKWQTERIVRDPVPVHPRTRVFFVVALFLSQNSRLSIHGSVHRS